MSSYAQAEDDALDINEDVDLEIGSLAEQEGGDVLEAAFKVPFVIKKVEIRTQLEDNKAKQSADNRWMVHRLRVSVNIGETGTDKEGANAGRYLRYSVGSPPMEDFIVQFNEAEFLDKYSTNWWQKQARHPMKELLAALGYDPLHPPRVNKDLLAELVGMEFQADIKKVPATEATDKVNEKGKTIYEKTGEFINVLANFRAV